MSLRMQAHVDQGKPGNIKCFDIPLTYICLHVNGVTSGQTHNRDLIYLFDNQYLAYYDVLL